MRPYVGGDELIGGTQRWCLWLKGISPAELKALPEVLKRIAGVAAARRRSPTRSVVEFADRPTLFTQDRQPTETYLAVPEVSSENRRFIPIAFLPSSVIASNKLQIVEGASTFHFGILSSTMHNAWMRTVGGRLKSDYSYSPAIYNNFPWPELNRSSTPDSEQKQALAPANRSKSAIETEAQAVLDARARFQTGEHPASLADLYDPLTMPPELLRAHQKLDAAVDKAYELSGGRKSYQSDAERVAFLFGLYQKYTSLLPAAPDKPGRKARARVG